MSNQNKLIPELRFPEFVNEAEWEEKVIGDVFDSYSGGTPNTSEREYYNGNIPFIRSAEINKEKTELFLSELGLKNSSAKLVDVGDLLVALYGANSGDSAISKINGAINQAILCLKSDVSNSFTQHYLSLKKEWIVTKFVQGGQGNLSGDIVKSIPIFVPKNPTEQQKIATCLSSLDVLLTAHTDKLETLKTYKKGLMQNLFPQEGEKVPKFRFKEFEKDGDWKKKSFDKLFEIGNGRDYKHLNKGEVPVYGTGGYMLSVDEYLYNGESACIGRKGTIDKPMFLEGKFWTVDTLFYTHSFNNCIPKFIFYIFQNIDWKKHNEAGGVPSLSKANIYKIEVFSPNPKEQQKIVDLLSSLDNLIQEQSNKIEQLKLHKKGLMQGLFPKVKN